MALILNLNPNLNSPLSRFTRFRSQLLLFHFSHTLEQPGLLPWFCYLAEYHRTS